MALKVCKNFERNRPLVGAIMKVSENMCHINLNSHAKFNGDPTIGGAITVKIALKNTIFA